MASIESVLHEKRVFEPSDEWKRTANVKPADFDRCSEVAEAVKRFWFATAMLPSAT